MFQSQPEQESPQVHYEGGIPVLPTAQEQAEAKEDAERQQEKAYKDRQLAFDGRMVFFTGALFLCTLITAAINACQTYVADKSAESAKTSADATKLAACFAQQTLIETENNNLAQLRAGQQSLAITLHNFRSEQRAWVAISGISGIPEAGKPFTVEVSAVNTGRTFAERFMLRSIVQVSPADLPPNFSLERRKVTANSISLLSPNGSYVVKNFVTGEASDPFRNNPVIDASERLPARFNGTQFPSRTLFGESLTVFLF